MTRMLLDDLSKNLVCDDSVPALPGEMSAAYLRLNVFGNAV
ncbi:MAG: hypothetical protein ABIV13_00755 [Fimbriimonadales bacterium]